MTSFLRTRKDRHPRTEAKPRVAQEITDSNANIDRFNTTDDTQCQPQDHLSRTITSQQTQDKDK